MKLFLDEMKLKSRFQSHLGMLALSRLSVVLLISPSRSETPSRSEIADNTDTQIILAWPLASRFDSEAPRLLASRATDCLQEKLLVVRKLLVVLPSQDCARGSRPIVHTKDL